MTSVVPVRVVPDLLPRPRRVRPQTHRGARCVGGPRGVGQVGSRSSLTGTSGAASTGNRAPRAKTAAYPTCVIASPASGDGGGGQELGGVLDPQGAAGPERSRALGDRGEGQAVVGDGEHGGDDHQGDRDVPAQPAGEPSSAITTAAATATQRSGRSLLPTRSERWPAAIRPRPRPPGPPRPGSPPLPGPAAVLDEPDRGRRSRPGTGGPRAAPRRHGSGPGTRRGGRGWARCRRAGPGAGVDHDERDDDGRQAAGDRRDPQRGVHPVVSATTAMLTAAIPTPTGWAICRMPIASPRRSGGNQPTTTRPLAALVLAALAPARKSVAASRSMPPTSAAAAPATVVATRPASSANRSPRRSETQAPRDQRGHHADGRRGGHQTGLGEAEALALVQHRDEERRAVHHDRRRRLGQRARAEHRPATGGADSIVPSAGHRTSDGRSWTPAQSTPGRAAYPRRLA